MNYISKKDNINLSDFEREKINKKYINKQLIELKGYFDNLYNKIDSNIKLDEEQRTAILTDEDYNMIIAGAGSGKTTTMAAKVKYLVDIKKINPKDILIISFTNKAVDELRQRINVDFKINCPIYTFHKLGLVLLNNKNIKIIDNPYSILKDYIIGYLCSDNKILKKFIKFFSKYLNISCFNFFFKNFDKYYTFLSIFIKMKPKESYFQRFVIYCEDIIKKIKIRNIDFNYFDNIDSKYDFFIHFIKELYLYYNNELKKNNYLDFEDIINEATICLENRKLSYKYIIVDEYQDISLQRFKLLKKINEVSNSKIIVVGDDFQSIYNFSGSDINLFTDFEKQFGYCSLLKITKTYRNSQELINIAGNFVMRNERQIKKQLISNKQLEDCINIIYYKDDRVKKLEFCLEDIISKYGNNQKILLLGRYLFDIKYYLGSCFKKENDKIISIKYPYLDITFLTVHSSKGLGFDQVVILNCDNGIFGFPSKIEEDYFIKLLNDNNQIEEERRLFYVALTRTKNKVYILSNYYKTSKFVLEIKGMLLK